MILAADAHPRRRLDGETRRDRDARDVRWGLAVGDLLRRRAIRYEDVLREAERFVALHGTTPVSAPAADEVLRRRFRDHLVATAKASGRWDAGCQVQDGYLGRGAGLGTFETALRAALEVSALDPRPR